MKVSYAITVCNEELEIKKLINVLTSYRKEGDEIVILYDKPKGTDSLTEYLSNLDIENYIYSEGAFDGHFANWKNQLKELCTGDYIFQIDADEYPHASLINSLHSLIESNPSTHVFLVPRVNTVEGLTQEYIQKWRWNVTNDGWVNWPDYQWRLWRNVPNIKWINKVHERLDGFQTYAPLPAQEQLALFHPKGIERQIRQNDFYDTLM